MIQLDAQIKAKVMDFLPEFKRWLDTDEATEREICWRRTRGAVVKALEAVKSNGYILKLKFNKPISMYDIADGQRQVSNIS